MLTTSYIVEDTFLKKKPSPISFWARACYFLFYYLLIFVLLLAAFCFSQTR